MLAIVAPGQGAQTPGFLAPWLEDQRFRTRMEWLSAVSGIDLIHYGTEADAETIRDTAIAQPLLVASGLVTALTLFPHPAEAFKLVGMAAGHSVGEITVAAGAGILTAEQAMVFVRERGNGMAAASAVTPTSMAAMVGGDADEVVAKLEQYGITPANYNGTGQIVAAGTVEQLDQLKEDLPNRVRMMPLSVAGAFHTEHMSPAVARLEQLSQAISTHDPRIRVLSNRDGHVVQSGQEYLQRLVEQVQRPVRWDLCMETMADLGVTGILELPPAKTLIGIAKRNLKGVETFALNTPDQLTEAMEFVRKHGEPVETRSVTSTPSWLMAVAPSKGQFQRTEGVDAGTVLPDGATVGTVKTLRDETPVIASHGGQVIEWLVEDGDPVAPGQPVIRLYPAVENATATEVSR